MIPTNGLLTFVFERDVSECVHQIVHFCHGNALNNYLRLVVWLTVRMASCDIEVSELCPINVRLPFCTNETRLGSPKFLRKPENCRTVRVYIRVRTSPSENIHLIVEMEGGFLIHL